MTDLTSPARRLYVAMLAINGQVGTNASTWSALGTVLKVDANDIERFLRRYTLLVGLPRAVRDLMSRPELVEMDSLVERMAEIEGWLQGYPNFVNPLVRPPHGQYNVSETAIENLRHIHQFIVAKGLAEPELPADEVELIRDELWALLDEVLGETDLASSVKSFLVDGIHKLIIALEDADLAGTEPVAEVTVEMAGRDRLDDDLDGPATHPLADRFWKLVARANELAPLINLGIRLAHPVAASLGLVHTPAALGPGAPPATSEGPVDHRG